MKKPKGTKETVGKGGQTVLEPKKGSGSTEIKKPVKEGGENG